MRITVNVYDYDKELLETLKNLCDITYSMYTLAKEYIVLMKGGE